MTKVKTNVFEEMMNKAKAEAASAEKELQEARKIVEKAEAAQQAAGKKVTELARIQDMTGEGWKEVHFGAWKNKGREGVSTYAKLAWKESWAFRTAQYDWWVSVKERTDLKKHKFEVTISGSKSTTSAQSWKGGYHDSEFIKDKYATRRWDSKLMKSVHDPIAGQELEKKFTSEADAMHYAAQWMKRLTEDHKDEIAYEVNLYNAAKALRK